MSKWKDGEWLLNFFAPYPDDYHVPLGALRACVNDAPTIESKQGEWIEIWENEMSNKAKCSECGRISKRPLGYFCRWCGVRMKGADDE